MGQQSNKTQKRARRAASIKRQKIRAKAPKKAKA
jgi:hypothetical protein